MIRVGFLLLLCTGAFAPNPILPGFQNCPKIIPRKNLILKKFVGFWFETHGFIPFPQAGKCATATYSQDSDGSLHMSLSRISFDNMQPVTTLGSGIFLGNSNGPTFVFKFANTNPGVSWILDTDYHTYYIGISCVRGSRKNDLNLFILQKQRKTTAAFRKQIRKVFDQYKLNISLCFWVLGSKHMKLFHFLRQENVQPPTIA